MTLRIYRINLDYIEYIHRFDNKVQYNKNANNTYNSNRPYIGIVLKIGEYNYFAPFEHPRPAHKNLKNNIHIFKIKNGRYGLVALNNMIPVPDEMLIDIDINSFTGKYKNILQNQYIYCNKYKEDLLKKASSTYNKRINKPNDFIKSICCDFKFLEKKCLEYETINNLRKKNNNMLSNTSEEISI